MAKYTDPRFGGLPYSEPDGMSINARRRRAGISEVVSPDAPIVTNDKGGSQSKVEARFDLIDGPSMFMMASVLHEGEQKYGANNWRKIPVEDHLNHLIMHAYAYLSGDRTDQHLSHIMCRAMFAQAVEIDNHERRIDG